MNSSDFEKFIQAFYSAIFGKNYIPLGGSGDGGADGWLSSSIFENRERNHFLQASITGDSKRKIRETVKRLREYGRCPKVLSYCTSKTAGSIDVLEHELSEELNCQITIRDSQYFTYQVNQSEKTIQAFNSYLAPAVNFLESAGAAPLISANGQLPARTLCVFIGQELERRHGKTQLLDAVVDSLILWSLEGTDPDKGNFLNRDEIEKKVLEAMPSAKEYFQKLLDIRLSELISKISSVGRKVNFHSSASGYCLPFKTRELMKNENIEDEALRLDVSKIFRQRASQEIPDKEDNQELIEQIVEVCHTTIQKTFLSQGLELSLFLADEEKNGEHDPPSIETHIDETLTEQALAGKKAGVIAGAALNILRRTFYNSTREERLFLGKLSRTYVLMFLLKNEPRIVEYLRTMKSNFCLYVGADIIVSCLSEHMLAHQDQMTKNALAALKAAGSQLILTDKTLDEVWHHLRASHLEYSNNLSQFAAYMKPVLTQQIDRILIRAFFDARFDAQADGKTPITWDRYVSQFCSAENLLHTRARDELREYLINEFKFDFESNEELESSIDSKEREALSQKILSARSKIGREIESEKILSDNTAATVLRVYARRKQSDERAGSNPYGHRTWWMTQQARVLKATTGMVAKKGSKYMMRPEFILHFLSNMPSNEDVRTSYSEVFPSILGIKLGNRMNEKAFQDVIEKAKQVYSEMDDSRAKVILATQAAQLQSDFMRKYD